MRVSVSLIILWRIVCSAACQANPVEAGVPFELTSSPLAESPSTAAPVSPTPGDADMTPPQSLPVDAGLRHLIDKAIADLSQRLSISTTQITLIEATPVVWPDASLGCPQPGMAYTQVQVDGLLIRLQAGEQIYEYHSGGVRDPFLCVKNVKNPNPPPQIDIFNLTPQPKSTPDSASTSGNSIPPEEDN